MSKKAIEKKRNRIFFNGIKKGHGWKKKEEEKKLGGGKAFGILVELSLGCQEKKEKKGKLFGFFFSFGVSEREVVERVKGRK